MIRIEVDNPEVEHEVIEAIQFIVANHRTITQLLEGMTMTMQDWEGNFQAINEGTNRMAAALTTISDNIEAMKDAISNMGLTAEQEAQLMAFADAAVSGIQAQATTAEKIAVDSNNPMPDVPTPPTPPTPPSP